MKPLSDALMALSVRFTGLEHAQNLLKQQYSALQPMVGEAARTPSMDQVPHHPIQRMVEDEVGLFNQLEDEDSDQDHVDLISGEQESVPPVRSRTWQPEEKHIYLWNVSRNMNPGQNSKDDWTRPVANKLRQFFNSHPSAKVFMAPDPDIDVPELKFRNQKDLERQLMTIQSVVGASAAAATDLVMAAQVSASNLKQTAEDYENPEVVIPNPREEAAELFADLSLQMNSEFGSKLTNLLKLIADGHNKLTILRRNQYVEAVTTGSTARNMMRKLPPSGDYLFGGEIQSVCNSLQSGSQLSQQLTKRPFKPRYGNYQQQGSATQPQPPRRQRFKPYHKKK